MTPIQIIQSFALLLTSLSALILLFSRLFVSRTNVVYERSRWFLIIQSIILSLHYVLQLSFGLRAMGDDVGTLVNIPFYMLACAFMSFSILNLQGGGRIDRSYIIIGSVACLSTWGIAAGASLYSGTLHQPLWILILMSSIFFVASLYFLLGMVRGHKRMKSVLERDMGNPAESFAKHLFLCTSMLYAFGIAIPCFVLNFPLLLFFGFSFLVFHILVSVSFICLGANIQGAAGVLQVLNDNNSAGNIDANGQDVTSGANEREKQEIILTEENIRHIEDSISDWREHRGYSDSDLTIASFAKSIGVNRRLLSAYFSKHVECTFRSWITRVRVEEAMNLLRVSPTLSGEAVAEECGFSSRSFYQTAFKSQTGYTPTEWAQK